MVGATYKQRITAALTKVRFQLQNEVSRLRRTLEMKQHFLGSIKNHVGVGQRRRYFRVALSRVPGVKKGSIFTARVQQIKFFITVDR